MESCMLDFEEETNQPKEEKMIFGDDENNKEVRMLGTCIEDNSGVKKRIQRAGKNWVTIKKH